MNDDDELTQSAMRFDKTAYESARELVRSAPLSLTEAHFQQLSIVSPASEDAARAALRQAQVALLTPAVAAAPLVTKSAEPETVVDETADAFLQRLGIPDVDTAGVTYNAKHFEAAQDRLFDAPETLTVADLQQFGVVDPQLARVARAAQLGHRRGYTRDEQKLLKLPISHELFFRWESRWLLPVLATYRYKGTLARTRIDELERRVLELEAAAAARSQRVEV